MSNKRVKNVAFLSYPENGLHTSLVSFLSSSGYRAVVSPLHEPDGEDLKPHYHVLVMLSSQQELESVKSTFLDYKVTAPFRVGDKTAYARYLSHLDNPEKQQFEGDDHGCTVIGCVDYDKLIFHPVSSVSVVEVYKRIHSIVLDEGLYSFAQLVLYCCDTNDIELLDYITKHTQSINLFVRSVYDIRWNRMGDKEAAKLFSKDNPENILNYSED